MRRECLHWCYHHPVDTFYFSDWGIPYRYNICVEEDTIPYMVGVQEQEAPITLRLYPNPAREMVTLQSSQPLQHLTVYDLYGRPIREATPHATEVTLSLQGWPHGTYLLSALTPQGMVCKTLVVQ